jgi:hypothetical protein
MKYIFLLGISSLLIACASNEKTVNETVSVEDLMGKVEGVEVADEKEAIETLQVLVSDGSNLSNLMVSLSPKYDTISLFTPHKMDRYGYNTSKKVRFTNTLNETNSVIDVYEYNFSDSLKLNNAFYNWLDCFGDKCSEIQLDEDVDKTQNPPSLTIVYDTTLVSVKYSLECNRANLKSFQDSILNKFGDEFRYVIQTDIRGNLKWK